MTVKANIHATAVVLGTRGFLFVGPSGTGKTTLALSCMIAARNSGLFAALVSDDQVLIWVENGQIVARRPASIAGLAEVRGAGIVEVETIPAAILDFAVLPVKSPFEPRLPPENETFLLPSGDFLPLQRLPYGEGLNSFEILQLILLQNADFQGQ
ncbi:HPr kinase/phosphorylase [Pararhizobium sp. BT-229]|uniref:HPr kinase/phosphorylase n=1 Tax=Pararhizobium sp. BT-229 TaxID=2986923 RepID=UPI0021F7E878|nr:HPr kinase/phosphorylase [Pararhizobium sp. BT-229]MCV9967319.1 HPr kinase/phosphorylase [Pararhizobium sp. BT-229]